MLTCPQFINYEHWLGCQNLVLVAWRVGDGASVDLSAVWWRWIAEVDLLSGAVDCRGSAVVDFSWHCQGLLVMSIVYKP